MSSGGLEAWSGLVDRGPVDGGERSRVHAGTLRDERVSVRSSRRSIASLEWELDLIDRLDGLGVRVPRVVPSDDGRRHVDGTVVQRWLDGRPPVSDDDWRLVADQLQRVHSLPVEADGPSREDRAVGQRPGCCSVPELRAVRRSVDADVDALPRGLAELVLSIFDEFVDVPLGVIHGDPGPDNIRIDADGHVGLLDLDESRVDLVWHDLSNVGIQVLGDDAHGRAQRLSDAWEVANAWVVEPAYARRRAVRLGWAG